MFEVRLRSKRVRQELDTLREADHQRVVARLKALADDPRPHGCERLYDDVYRVRVGGIRIIYIVDEENNHIEVGGDPPPQREDVQGSREPVSPHN